MFSKIVKLISNFALSIACVTITVMMLATFIDVIARLIIGRPISGVTELSQVCLMCVCASFAAGVLAGAHTMVDAFTSRFPAKVRRIVNLLTLVITVVWCFLMAWQAWNHMLYSKKMNIIYALSGIREWWVVLIFGISFLAAGIATVYQIKKEWKQDSESIAAESEAKKEEDI